MKKADTENFLPFQSTLSCLSFIYVYLILNWQKFCWLFLQIWLPCLCWTTPWGLIRKFSLGLWGGRGGGGGGGGGNISVSGWSYILWDECTHAAIYTWFIKTQIFNLVLFNSENCDQYPDPFTHCPYEYLDVLGQQNQRTQLYITIKKIRRGKSQ